MENTVGNPFAGARCLGVTLIPGRVDSAAPMISAKVSKLSAALALVFFLLSASGTTYSVIIPVKAKGSGPLFRVQRQGRWGYMTRRGRVVIKPQFMYAEDFFDGLAAVQLGEKWGYIKESGEFRMLPQFDSAMSFDGERASVKVNGLAGLIDRDGRFVVSPRFEEIRRFSDGLAAVWLDAKRRRNAQFVWVYGGRWGFIDRSGKIVVEPQFDWVQDFSEGLAAAGVGGKRDAQGNVTTMDGVSLCKLSGAVLCTLFDVSPRQKPRDSGWMDFE
jgi:hypothetical protein